MIKHSCREKAKSSKNKTIPQIKGSEPNTWGRYANLQSFGPGMASEWVSQKFPLERNVWAWCDIAGSPSTVSSQRKRSCLSGTSAWNGAYVLNPFENSPETWKGKVSQWWPQEWQGDRVRVGPRPCRHCPSGSQGVGEPPC